MRTSDADRTQVTTLLDSAFAEGRISYDEHNERTTAALRSRTFDDLIQLTADLVPEPSALTPVPVLEPTTAAENTRLSVILASDKRVGPWKVGRSTEARVLLGDVLIDLTQATFASTTIEVDCSVFLGSTKIRVPTGTNVRVEVTNILAETSVKGVGTPDPKMPTVIVKGVNFLGDIQVRGPKQPLPWKRHVA
jgi:Domain of unknown function (DUF1707)/Cell wall-active antibiotics response 4TMS YvqF